MILANNEGNRLMPSSQTSKPALQEKIHELEKMASLRDGLLSPANQKMLEMYRRWYDLAGRDVCVVIAANDRLGRTKPVPRIVEVTDQLAADLITHAPARGDLVRLATDEETAAWKKYNLALGQRAKNAAIKKAQEAAQLMLAQTMGLAQAQFAGAGVDDEPPPPPTPGPVVDPDEGAAEKMVPVIPSLDGDDDPENPASALPQDSTLTPNAELLAAIPGLKPSVVEAIQTAGFISVEQLATASPDDLAAKVKGVGPATAAKIVVAAGQADVGAE